MKLLKSIAAFALCNMICCQSFLGKNQNPPATAASRVLQGKFGSNLKVDLPNKLFKESSSSIGDNVSDEIDIATSENTEDSNPDRAENSNTNEDIDDGALIWNEIPVKEAKANPVTAANFAFGLRFALGQGIQSAALNNVDYNTYRVFAVWEAINGTEVTTKVDCLVIGDQNNPIPVNISVVVNYDNQTNSRKMLNFSYALQAISTDNVLYNLTISWNSTNEIYKAEVYPVDFSQGESRDKEADMEEWLEINDFDDIKLDDLKSNQTLSDILQKNANQLISNYQDGKTLPKGGNYTIAEIYGAYERFDYSAVNYYVFDVLIADEMGNKARMNYEVSYDLDGGYYAIENNAFRYIQNVAQA